MAEKTETKKPAGPSKVLAAIKSEIDAHPTNADVLARVIRVERVVEKLSKKSLDEVLGEAEG